jgi:hypothetical protein
LETHIQFNDYSFKTKEEEGNKLIWDEVRRKYVFLTPEEWVRQHLIHYMVHQMGYPKTLIAVEKGVDVNGLKRRFDIAVYNTAGTARMIIECKAPEEPLNENVLMQIAAYNLPLKVEYLWVSNGNFNYCCKLGNRVEVLPALPEWTILNA